MNEEFGIPWNFTESDEVLHWPPEPYQHHFPHVVENGALPHQSSSWEKSLDELWYGKSRLSLSMQTFFTMDFLTELRASDLGFTEDRLALSDDPGPSNPPPLQASEMPQIAPPLLKLEGEADDLRQNHSHVTSGPQHVALSPHLVRYVKICLILLEISRTITFSNSSHTKTGKEKYVQLKFINPFRSMTTMTGNSKGLIRPPMKRKAQKRERERRSAPLSFF
jgi:hypothetical protein